MLAFCNSARIIKDLSSLAQTGIGGYRASVDSWLRNYEIDCPEKKDALLRMFEDSSVALIYGSAGTGKSTLINHISNFFSDRDKIYLANTHPAVENMRRKVKTAKSDFKTVKSFLSDRNLHRICDILVIDECMKGQITNITLEDQRIWFEVELEIAINEWDAFGYDFDLLGLSDNENYNLHHQYTHRMSGDYSILFPRGIPAQK